jgi:uncharacterized protein YceH (UPF0502 family)
VLLLRGPQTGAELRSRTERMCEFEGIAEVDAELERLSGRPEPLAALLPRRPGQKEERWVQLLTDASEGALAHSLAAAPGGSTKADVAAEVAELRTEVAELRVTLVELQDQLESLRRELGQ